MATRALIDASIDSFWNAAGVPCPTNTHCLEKRSASLKLPKSLSQGGSRAPPAAPAEVDVYKKVTVMLTGREGHNAAAVNGLWYYWRVKGGRLAFQRQIVLPSAEEDGDDGPSPQLLRLFLYYVPPTDAFVISDSCDATVGSIMADCGPIGEGMDLEQNWRVWDGGGWKEDRNVEAEIRVPDTLPLSMSGLRVAAPPSTARGQRTGGRQEPPLPRAPLTARPAVRTPRQLDSVAGKS